MVSRAATSALVALALAGCASTPDGPGLAGSIVGHDDTGRADYPVGDGWIVAAPAETAAILWADEQLPADITDFAHLGFDLRDADLAAADAVRVPVTSSGQFRLDAPPGPSVVCWLQSGGNGPMRSVGCTEIDLPEDGRLKGHWGEGGFFVEVE
jgi:hypothetical protein